MRIISSDWRKDVDYSRVLIRITDVLVPSDKKAENKATRNSASRRIWSVIGQTCNEYIVFGDYSTEDKAKKAHKMMLSTYFSHGDEAWFFRFPTEKELDGMAEQKEGDADG